MALVEKRRVEFNCLNFLLMESAGKLKCNWKIVTEASSYMRTITGEQKCDKRMSQLSVTEELLQRRNRRSKLVLQSRRTGTI